MKTSTVSTILKLANNLRQSGYSKYADELEFKYLILKKSEMQNYNVIKEVGQDLIDMAHPEGSHKLVGVDGDSVFETIFDQKEKIEKTVKKDPIGKLSAKDAIFQIKKLAKLPTSSDVRKIFENLNAAIKRTETARSEISRMEDVGASGNVNKFENSMRKATSELQNAQDAEKSALDELSKLNISVGKIEKIKQDSEKLKKLYQELSEVTSSRSELISKGRSNLNSDELVELAGLDKAIENFNSSILVAKKESEKNINDIVPSQLKRFFTHPATLASGGHLAIVGINELVAACRSKISEISSSANPSELKDQAQQILNEVDDWSVTHPAIDSLKYLVTVLQPFADGGVVDFAKLSSDQRNQVISALEKLKTSLISGSSSVTLRHALNFIPLLNLAIDLNDTVALGKQAAVIATNVQVLIDKLRGLNANLTEVEAKSASASRAVVEKETAMTPDQLKDFLSK